jgi:hypothetical protein
MSRNRRSFLGTLGTVGAGLSLGGLASASDTDTSIEPQDLVVVTRSVAIWDDYQDGSSWKGLLSVDDIGGVYKSATGPAGETWHECQFGEKTGWVLDSALEPRELPYAVGTDIAVTFESIVYKSVPGTRENEARAFPQPVADKTAGETGTIIGEPVYGDGTAYWPVDFGSARGWIEEPHITPVGEFVDPSTRVDSDVTAAVDTEIRPLPEFSADPLRESPRNTIPQGTTGRVWQGYKTIGGYDWWFISWDVDDGAFVGWTTGADLGFD